MKNSSHPFFSLLLLLTPLLCFCAFSNAVSATEAPDQAEELKIMEVFPADGGQDVFLSSGIEITFNSDTVSTSALQESLVLSPDLEYYVSVGEKPETILLYPRYEYEPNTQYRVTIRAGLTDKDGRTLPEDVSFSFITAAEELEDYYTGIMPVPSGQGSVVNALTDEIPAAFLMIDQDLAGSFPTEKPEAEVTLYRFQSDDDYLRSLVQKLADDENNWSWRRQGQDKDPSRGIGITEEKTFRADIQKISAEGSYWWWGYEDYVLSFPESLPEGKYLARLDFPVRLSGRDITITKYLLVQSTELSVFTMSSGQETVAWIHNGITGEAVEAARVSLFSSSVSVRAGETAADGTAVLTSLSGNSLSPEKTLREKIPYDFQILDVRSDDARFIEAVSDNVLYSGYSGFSGYGTNTEYYTYIYTDRQIYSTTDEVQFFGVVKPRRPGISVPASLDVKLYSGWWGYEEIASVQILPDEDGCFTGSLSFEDQQAAEYVYLSVQDEAGMSLMSSDGFSIEDYVKPTYTSTVQADKPVYVLGENRDEEAVILMNISYFDETPASGFGLEEEWSDYGLSPFGEVLTADEKGNIEDHILFDADAFSDTWRPQYVSVHYRSADIEDEILYLDQELIVIPRDMILTSENVPGEEKLKISTFSVDTSGIAGREDLYKTDAFRGEGISAEVSGTLYRCWYEKVFDGMRYDYIYKQSREVYHYVYHKDIVEEFTVNTTDGEGFFSYHIEKDEENPASYYVELTGKDSAGRRVRCTAGIYYRSPERYLTYGGGNGGTPEYRLKAVVTEEEVPSEDPDMWAWYYEYEHTFSEDAPAQFVLVRDGEEFEMPEGAELLSAALLDGFSAVEAGTSADRSVEFSEDLLPNYYMTGAYFDGRNTWPLCETSMVFDFRTRELAVHAQGDRESYRPGESVTLHVDVTRKKDGSPVPEGTKVAIGVVDEAVFALREQNISLLETLYGRFGIYYSSYSSRNTATPSQSSLSEVMEETEEAMMETSAAGDMDYGRSDGENGEYIRQDFVDTAFFSMAETDEKGRADFTFRIPDNMTSWRVTALAITEDVWAGSETTDIVCTVPYYTVPVLNDTLLEGDTFAIGLRSAGTADGLSECSYEVTVRQAGEDIVLRSGTADSANLRDYTWVCLDGLPQGSYTVRIRGTCGEYTDVSEYPFEVVRSGLEAYAARSGDASILKEIQPLRYPADIIIYNRDAFVYNTVLSRLLCSREIRADERLGRHYALSVLASDTPYMERILSEHDISDLKSVFPQFRYGKNDAEISALAYLAVPELIGNRAVRGILPEDISQGLDSPYTGSSCSAYLLQALAGDIAAGDDTFRLEELLREEGTSFRDRMYLTAALFVLGMEEEAGAAYDQYVVPYLSSAEAVSGETVYFLNADADTTVQDDTAAALIMASLLHREEARGLALYLVEKPSDKNIYPLEEVLYLKNCDEKETAACTVSYMLDGEMQTRTLSRNQRICLNLQKKALENLDLTVLSGDPCVTVLYIAGVDELTDESTMKLSASVAFDKASYLPGDEARITVTPDIGSLDPSIGCSTMVLDVYIPSGMRFVRYTPDSRMGSHWYLVSREGQRLRFVIYDSSQSRSGAFRPVTFTASCVTPGEYIVEKAYLSSNHYDTWGLSERGTITITE